MVFVGQGMFISPYGIELGTFARQHHFHHGQGIVEVRLLVEVPDGYIFAMGNNA